ncbi:hypothetical protein C8F04DRAFT_1227078, partial [Mycena alexandri]
MSVQKVQARIDNLTAEIERQKKVLDQLERSKKAAYRQLNAIRDPVARLPLEISSEIFLQCLSFSPKPPADPHAAPMFLLNICNAWTNIALSNPALWAAVYIRCPCDELLRIWLKRARGYPLSVAVEGEFKLDNEIAIVGEYSKQLKNLEIYATEPDLGPFITAGSFPRLETSEIGSLDPYDISYVSIAQIIDLLRLAPNLVELALHHVETLVDYDSEAGKAILPNIRSLKFGTTTNVLQSHDDFLEYISLPDLTTLFFSFNFISAPDFSLFLERSSPPLQTLGLGRGCQDLAFSELVPCLRIVPSL